MDIASGGSRLPEITLWRLFLKFLRFGFLAFGGPVAQIAMLRQSLVDDERWIDNARFNRLLAVLQALPGPEAHELCVHFGIIARGRVGGILAGLGFMLPGLLLMLGAGWLYVSIIAGRGIWTGPLVGIQIVVLAVILRAVFRIGQHILANRWLWSIAAGGLISTLVGTPFWLPLVVGGAVYAVADRRILAASMVTVGIISTFISAQYLSTSDAPGSHIVTHVTALALFTAGLKGGLLTFGGAYTAIPYVRADTVGRGWLNDATFLDGIAVAGILPAPLVIFATFVGYVSGGMSGALAITAGMFLPAFAFSLIFFERLEALIQHPSWQRILEGIAAAVVGIIAGTFLQLAGSAAARVSSPVLAITIFLVGLVLAWRLKGAWVTPMLLTVGALAGALVSL